MPAFLSAEADTFALWNLETGRRTLNQATPYIKFNSDHFGIIRFTNNDGRARHSVRAAGWQPTRSAGSGLPALPAFSSWFVIWIIPDHFVNSV